MKLSEADILLVDDEPALREIFQQWLTLAGCGHVRTAANGEEALSALRDFPSQVVVTDVRMPVMDGITLVRRLAEFGLHIPSIIFVSGFGDVDEKEMYHLGVEAFISKPLERKALIDILERAIAERATLWLEPMPIPPRQTMLLDAQSIAVPTQFPAPIEAASNGIVCLGKGGFSAQYSQPLNLGKVAFDCRFQVEGQQIVGQGYVRWHSRTTQTVGIEFAYLDPCCRAWLLETLEAQQPLSYIPSL